MVFMFLIPSRGSKLLNESDGKHEQDGYLVEFRLKSQDQHHLKSFDLNLLSLET